LFNIDQSATELLTIIKLLVGFRGTWIPGWCFESGGTDLYQIWCEYSPITIKKSLDIVLHFQTMAAQNRASLVD